MFKELKVQFDKNIKPTLSLFLTTNPDYRMVFTGHSLGGGFATGLYLTWGLYCKSTDPQMSAIPVTLITFAAPTMIHSVVPEIDAKAEMGQYCVVENMHHFVNQFDVVPRILGGKYHEDALKTLADITGYKIGNAEEIKNYKAIGNYYYLKNDNVYTHVYDSTAKKDLLLELPLALRGLVRFSFSLHLSFFRSCSDCFFFVGVSFFAERVVV